MRRAFIIAGAVLIVAGVIVFMCVQKLKSRLKAIMPHASDDDIAAYAPWLWWGMSRYRISSKKQQTVFLSQGAHESNELWHLREKYNTDRGEEYASGSAYEGRANLGNTEAGDGVRFKGRGFLQTTGRANYQAAGDKLGVDFVANPELLNQPKWSVLSACQFWVDHNLNELSEAGTFEAVTRVINGGLNGIDDRRAFLARADEAFSSATNTEET